MKTLGTMSTLGRIKMGLTTIVMSIVGLVTSGVAAVIAVSGGIAIMIGNDKLINLHEKMINTVTDTIEIKYEEMVNKIVESEIGDLEE